MTKITAITFDTNFIHVVKFQKGIVIAIHKWHQRKLEKGGVEVSQEVNLVRISGRRW